MALEHQREMIIQFFPKRFKSVGHILSWPCYEMTCLFQIHAMTLKEASAHEAPVEMKTTLSDG